MPNLSAIKSHSQSIRAIAKTTKALAAVSGARRQRLLGRLRTARKFAEKASRLLAHLVSAAPSAVRDDPAMRGHPDVKAIGLVLVTSNRGMVGGYNHNVIALASRFVDASDVPVEVITIGRVGHQAMERQERQVRADFVALDEAARMITIAPLADDLLAEFESRRYDEVVIAYTQLGGGSALMPRIRHLLPIPVPAVDDLGDAIYEPGPEELMRALLPRVVRFELYLALLESFGAENTARMIAMHTATRNSEELIEQLTLKYNKARQETITKELIDIMSGMMTLRET